MTPELKLEKMTAALNAALNELDDQPHALLFLAWEEDCFDYDVPENIAGLPVMHHQYLRNKLGCGYGESIPWIPIWKSYPATASLEYLENFNETYLKIMRR